MFLILSLSLGFQEPAADLGTTVVTARKIEEAIEDVPASVSVLSSDDITKSGMRSISDAVGRVPNLHFTEFSARRLSFPFVRGIGSGLGEPAVVTYIDGVPQFSVGSTNLPLMGLDRVEFLRGPQGTLYGRNAMGGVINMVGRQPGEQAQETAGALFGNHALQEYTYSYAGPVGENVGFVFDVMTSRRDGYTTNDFTGNKVDDRDAFSGRMQLSFDTSDSSSLRIGVSGQMADDGGFGLFDLGSLRSNPHHINNDFEGATSRDTFQPAVVYEWEENGLSFTSISAMTKWDVTETSDLDFKVDDDLRRNTIEDQSVFYQEFRLANEGDLDLGAGSGSRWLLGVSGFSSDSNQSVTTEVRALKMFFEDTGAFDDDGVAVFGQMSMSPASGLELTGGLRYDRESREVNLNNLGTISSFDESFSEVSPMVSASYHSSESSRFYGYAAKAFRAGGFNLTAPTAGDRVFDPETSWTYEVGYKRTLVEDGLDLRLAAFHVDWKDMQLSLYDAGQQIAYVQNAGKSTSEGLELELDADLGGGWGAFLGVGVASTEYEEFTDLDGNDFAGKALANAPEQTWNVGLRYEGDHADLGKLFASVNYVAIKELFYDPSNLEGENYELVNLNLGLRRGDWRASLFVRNALDEAYVPFALALDGGAYVGENGAPRTLGLSIGISF